MMSRSRGRACQRISLPQMASNSQPNSTAPEDDRPNLRSIRIAFLLTLISAGIVVLLSSSGDTQWHEAHPGSGGGGGHVPLWMPILWITLPVVPYLLSGLLLSVRNDEIIALGAGVAAGFFGLASLFGLGALGGLMFLNFFPGPYDLPSGIAMLAFLAGCAWGVVSAFRIGQLSWAPFWVGLVTTLASMALGNHALQQWEHKLDEEYQERQAETSFRKFVPSTNPQKNIVYITSCLIVNHTSHPAAFPRSLDPGPEFRCGVRFSPTMVPDFTLSYTPHFNVMEQISDFHLVALARANASPKHNPLMIDRRGIVFAGSQGDGSGVGKMIVMSSDWEASRAGILRNKVDAYLRTNQSGIAPAQLDADILGDFDYDNLSDDADGTTLEVGNFTIRYLGPKAGAPDHFAIMVGCQSYGDNCLRSYLLDYDGVIHATGEPRRATSDDLPALKCEIMRSECEDVGWSLQ